MARPCVFLSSHRIYGGFAYLAFPRWASMAAPAERLTGPRGTLRGGKISASPIESGILWIPGSAFGFFYLRHPIYGVFVYLAFPRRALALRGTSPGESPGTSRNAAERKNGGITSRIWDFRDSWVGLLFFLLRRPFYGVFAYLALPRWALGVNGRPRGTSPGTPRNHAERCGAVKWRNCD